MRGGIHVFDNYSGVREDLGRDTFVYLDAARSFYISPTMRMEQLDSYWWNVVARGRRVTVAEHGTGITGYPLQSYSFTFTPEEMAKLHVHAVDIVTDSVAVSNKLDLSVWFEGWYFLPPPLIEIAWAKIIDNTEIGGYILTDLPYPSEMSERMGIRLVGHIRGRLYRNGETVRYLYQKERDTEAVTGLVLISSR